MQKQVWIALGVVVLAVVGWLIYANTRTQPTTTETPTTPTLETQTSSPSAQEQTGTSSAQQETAQTVTYTDAGFSPKTVNVEAGEIVTFVNNSSKMMWVASAPHPAHTNYPEFDAKKGYEAGQSYSFSFDKRGTWNYHNHLTPTNFGTVVVE